MSLTTKYRPDIDGLRAISVMAVVLYHTFPNLIKGGFVGVDIFFVISGFLISSIIFQNLENDKFSYIDFYSRRIRRIFPALILVLVTCFIVGWFSLRPDEYKYLGKYIAVGGGFITNFVLWSEAGYFDAAAETKPLLHLWSLAIEEQFYILWPLLLGFVWKKKYNFLAITILIGISSFAINLYSTHTDPTAAFYSPLSRFWELMIGGVLAYLVLHKNEVLAKHSKALSIVGLALIVASLFFINSGKPFPGWRALVPTLGAFCIIAASPNSWVNRTILSNKVMVWIGLISYPLYLWHWPVLYVAKTVDANLVGVFTISLSVLLGWLTYQYVEKPIRFGTPKIIVPSLSAAASIVVALGITAHVLNGFDYRIPSDIRPLYNMVYNKVFSEWRQNKCYLQAEDDSKFTDECLDNNKSLVFLWGDSHAAALYPGLEYLKSINNFGVGQYTSSGCPPLLGWDDPVHASCKKSNDYVISVIEKTKPHTVILHADWKSSERPEKKPEERYDLSKLEHTVRSLKRIGVENVYVIGPVPQWKRSLPTMLWECRQLEDGYGRDSTDFSKCGLDQSIARIDKSIGKLSSRLGVKYLSAYKTMCNESGCLTRIDGEHLSTFDHGHLSPEGAKFVMAKLLVTK